MGEMRKVKYKKLSYGTLRDWMFDEGILDLFSTNTIYNTVNSALPIITLFLKQGILNKAPKAKKSTEMHDLMHGFFQFAGIRGYDWEHVVGDLPSQAAFAQLFLEYISFNVMPLWNKVEKLMTDHMTYRTQETEGKLVVAIGNLLAAFQKERLFGFMKKYLRFPNMEVHIIDYSNANKEQRKLLDKYRKDLGIPDAKGKDTIIGQWIKRWNTLANMTDEELQKSIDDLAPILAKAEFESRYTGDLAYFQQLMKVFKALNQERTKRLNQQAKGSTIVQKSADVAQNVLEPPPKTLAEIEEERRKKAAEEAAKKAEEERKAKEEHEKKLKEEAKRKEALAIANAKIKAMEAIRKQEENYETILSKMINDPGSVTDKELKSLGDEVNNLKQEAENKIANLPREERELKLALIRGDKISEKTFAEIKETAVGLHGNLQEYIEEVSKIPVGSVMAIQNSPAMNAPQPIQMQDSDSVDLGD